MALFVDSYIDNDTSAEYIKGKSLYLSMCLSYYQFLVIAAGRHESKKYNSFI